MIAARSIHYAFTKEESDILLANHPEKIVNNDCHCEERSDVTIPIGIASINMKELAGGIATSRVLRGTRNDEPGRSS